MYYLNPVSGLYEMLKYAINKFYFNLVAKTRNLKEVIHNKIDPISYEIAGIHIITLAMESHKEIY